MKSWRSYNLKTTGKTELVAEQQALSSPLWIHHYAQRRAAFDEQTPVMTDLDTQIRELENQVWQHRDAVKTWGKRIASNWIGRLLKGQS